MSETTTNSRQGKLEPLATDLAALLEAERTVPPVPRARRQRVLEAVAARVVAQPAPPPLDGGADAAGTSAAATGGLLVAKKLLWAGALFVAGATAGVVADRSLRAPSPAGATAESSPSAAPRPVARPKIQATAPVARPPRPANPPAPAAAPAAAASRRARRSPARPRATRLARERELLDVARAAVSRANGAAALAAVGRHARRFPRGLLREERESLAIQALSLLGRLDEARGRYARFRREHPQSLLRGAIEARLGEPRRRKKGIPLPSTRK